VTAAAPPAWVLQANVGDARRQLVDWPYSLWVERPVFKPYRAELDAIEEHWADKNGIDRTWLYELADDESRPMLWFFAVMAWGHGPSGFGAARTERMFSKGDPSRRVKTIREEARRSASRGWTALFDKHSKVPGLSGSFGTKLVHFAGWRHTPAPRPLILDDNVAAALADAGIAVPRTWTHDFYLQYLNLAEAWATQAGFVEDGEVGSDVVEQALLVRGRYLKRTLRREAVLRRMGRLALGERLP
jgi:hypothetical protein